jgi:dTDP-4-amino-4,6-dideoxygalactose transaminase
MAMPYKVDEVRVVADRYGIHILEDSAEALVVVIKAGNAVLLVMLSALSFNGNKIITTSLLRAIVTPSKDWDKTVFLPHNQRGQRLSLRA